MDAAQIAAMIADINVGTEPHWWSDQLEFYLDEDNGYSDQKTADYRRISRVPDMEATIIAQAAELERLRAALTMLLPQNLGPLPERAPDSGIIPVDMTFGEIRQARAALKGGTK